MHKHALLCTMHMDVSYHEVHVRASLYHRKVMSFLKPMTATAIVRVSQRLHEAVFSLLLAVSVCMKDSSSQFRPSLVRLPIRRIPAS